jgi:hypothetical protein
MVAGPLDEEAAHPLPIAVVAQGLFVWVIMGVHPHRLATPTAAE